MLSACLNYTNLSTARALTRAKEIGVRKVTGAYRRDLIFQFLSESIITSLFALTLAILFLIFIKPAFINLWLNKYLNFDLHANPSVYLMFAAFAIVIGIVAGLYPALHLSSFHPIKAIKNAASVTGGKLGMRKVLSVSQFVISLFFVITSILIYTQFKFFTAFEYGFEFKDVVNISLQGNEYQKISTAFNTIPGVTDISASEYVPGTGRSSGMDINHPESQEPINFRILSANERFLDNLNLKIIAGSGLPATMDSISRQIVVNETAAKALGFEQPSDVVGTTVIQSWNKEQLEVVGVVEDFWINLPIGGDALNPAFLRNQLRFSYANVKIASASARETLKQLEEVWKKLDPYHPFKYEYYDEELAATHEGIFDLVTIVGFLAFIAVTIACLGMLGMATYTAERKKKEVGIRKVMGAKDIAIALMLSKDFLKVLVIASCIGAPLTYMINNLWLQNFAVRADFGIELILSGTFLLLFLGLLAIGSQTFSAAKRNPVESLKAD
jgi:putative ABC transport system permease protein